MKILILNCFSRNALAVINSIDSSYTIIGGVNHSKGYRKWMQKNLFYSKRLSQIEEYANPAEDKNQFFQDLIKICNRHKIDAIFPTGTTATNYLSYFKKDLQNQVKARILVEDYDTFSQLTDKWETYNLCKKIGIPVPKTVLFANKPETIEEIKQLSFPIIAKPRISYASHGVLFFNTISEFQASIDKLTGFQDPGSDIHEPYIIQEVIQGSLHDVALCAYEGKPAMMLSQKRVMTLRDFGGGGIINLTTYEPEMMEYAKGLIRELKWNGPALFDFIKTKDNQYYLLEINPKIWGTTRLTVEAGMNLPQAMIDLFVLDKAFTEKTEYEKNLLYKWMFPECMAAWFLQPFSFDRILQRIKKSFNNYNASRVCTNIRSGDLRHLIGIILEKAN